MSTGKGVVVWWIKPPFVMPASLLECLALSLTSASDPTPREARDDESSTWLPALPLETSAVSLAPDFNLD